jgi:hypothetical protein
MAVEPQIQRRWEEQLARRESGLSGRGRNSGVAPAEIGFLLDLPLVACSQSFTAFLGDRITGAFAALHYFCGYGARAQMPSLCRGASRLGRHGRLMELLSCLASSLAVANAQAEPLKSNPTPTDHVERSEGSASRVPRCRTADFAIAFLQAVDGRNN